MVINTRKAWLRAQIRQRLTSSLGLDLRTRESLQVQHLLSSLKEFEQAQNVAVYCSTLQEVDTDGIIQALFQAGIPIFRLMKLGKSCFIPVWNKKEMQMTKLANNDVFKDLPLNKWGIRYLDAPGATEWIDLIIVPGLAFNLDKKRLGHGKGYYDAYLTRCANLAKESGRNPPITIALSLSLQVTSESIPWDSHDVLPDILITPDQIIR